MHRSSLSKFVHQVFLQNMLADRLTISDTMVLPTPTYRRYLVVNQTPTVVSSTSDATTIASDQPSRTTGDTQSKSDTDGASDKIDGDGHVKLVETENESGAQLPPSKKRRRGQNKNRKRQVVNDGM